MRKEPLQLNRQTELVQQRAKDLVDLCQRRCNRRPVYSRKCSADYPLGNEKTRSPRERAGPQTSVGGVVKLEPSFVAGGSVK